MMTQTDDRANRSVLSRLTGALARLTLIGALGLSAGCGTLHNGKGWGEEAIWPVQWQRIPTAARNALFDPMTWVPAAGALVFAIDDFDEETARWAAREQPVFRSRETALDLSDHLRDALDYEIYATLLLTGSGDDPLDWTFAKAKGFAVEYGGLRLNRAVYGQLKHLTDRERPDGSDKESFPSGHASMAFAGARLSNRNLDSIQMTPWARNSLKAANVLMASSVAWARVEAGVHFPSDVLAGAALGNFITTFIHDAFLNLPEESSLGFFIEPSPSGLAAALSFEF
jgi:membrane-associated phospholipid phosphatase